MKKIIDVSPIIALNLSTYSIVYNNNLYSILDEIEDNTIKTIIEESITKNILLCLIKNIKLPNNLIFELALDIVNETFSTTLNYDVKMNNSIIHYVNEFKDYLNKIINTKILETHIPIDNYGDYRILFMEKNNEINYRETTVNAIYW